MTPTMLVAALAWVSAVDAISRHPLVLLISFDGFRHDLLNETLTPSIYKWAKEGVIFSQGSRSQFISVTEPNHISIATGLVEESHGVVANEFYDPDTREQFDIFNNSRVPGAVNRSLERHWYKGEPIWLTNERADPDRRSVAMQWPGGEAPFPVPPHTPYVARQWIDMGDLNSWMSDVDQVVAFFANESKPVNFIAWYVGEPDHTLHQNGFHNGALRKMLSNLDKLFEYLIQRLTNFELIDDVNIIFTADHGHAEILDYKHVFCPGDYIDLNATDLNFGDHMIYPANEEQAKAIFANLTKGIEEGGFSEGVRIYRKKDFPARFSWKDTPRVGEIIIDSDSGWATSFNCSAADLRKRFGPGGPLKFNASTHGSDPDEWMMRAVLAMRGPVFAKGKKIDSIPSNTDLYELMSHILGVTPAPNNGSMSIVSLALRAFDAISGPLEYVTKNFYQDSIGFFGIVLPTILLVLLAFSFILHRNFIADEEEESGFVTGNGYKRLNGRASNDLKLKTRSSGKSVKSPPQDFNFAISSEDEL